MNGLQLNGKEDKEGQSTAWEEIVRKNSETNDNGRYSNYVEDYRAYNDLLNEFQKIKAMIISLSYKYNKEYVDYLNIKGYRIYNTKTENGKEDTQKYTDSLIRASSQSDNLRTKIKMKQNELVKYSEGANKQVRSTFDSAIANMMYDLKLNLDDNITLARFNELRKISKARSPKVKQHERGN